MKKLYTFLTIAFVVVTVKAQIVNIPDANFKAKLLAASATNSIATTQLSTYSYNNDTWTPNQAPYYSTIDLNADGEIQVSEAQLVKGLRISSSNIVDLTGIEKFTNLQYLLCDSNQIVTLTINEPTSLEYLQCRLNHLTSLNLSGCTNLNYLNCMYNQLVTIDTSALTHLSRFFCMTNSLTSLDVSTNIQLTSINCGSNNLTALDVSNLHNLQGIYCSYNHITSLDVSNNPYFNSLIADNNAFTYLNLKSGAIQWNYLQFSANPNLQYVCADEQQVASIQSRITSYGYTNCHVNSYCSFVPGGTFYTIQGNEHYDSNSDGCDASDILYPNMNFTVSSGTASWSNIANANGNYSIPVQAGTNTITPVLENPAYFILSPTATTVSFPAQASPYTQNFCITANGTHNDLEIVLVPIIAARPGFDAIYKIIYKNKGTGTQSGSVNLTYNDSVLDFVLATPSITTASSNTLSWSFSNLLPFETREIMVRMNVNSPVETPSVNAGDALYYSAAIEGATDETPIDNTTVLNQLVVNAVDPNDKTCLEGIAITPSMVGNDVHYVIRFQNDGTANAQNIVVKDMIDAAKFDISTLVPLSGSAPFVTRITNTNKVEFIFENINLPFATGSNTGYVAFKIKTKPTLVLGDTFSNSANIYFDYNAAIVTNTYTTTIQALATQDFDFSTYFSVYPVPAKQVLNIQTKQTIGVKSIAIYNVMGQLVTAITNAQGVSSIDVANLKTGTYFIKVDTDKGTANAKFVKE